MCLHFHECKVAECTGILNLKRGIQFNYTFLANHRSRWRLELCMPGSYKGGGGGGGGGEVGSPQHTCFCHIVDGRRYRPHSQEGKKERESQVCWIEGREKE